MKKISVFNIQRLILYRKIIRELMKSDVTNIYSHKLAQLSGNSSAQVRRDLMAIKYQGTTNLGYDLKEIDKSISDLIDNPDAKEVVLVGVGHLGRAILDYIKGLKSFIKIVATFDTASDKVGRVLHTVICHDIKTLESFVKENKIKVGIITVPNEAAQTVAERMVSAGIVSILNFSQVRLKLPAKIFIENIDVMQSLEKTSYYAHKK